MKSPRVVLLALLFAVAAQINGQVYQTVVRTDIKGRLLTPDEGCGFSKVANTRIVGGGPAKNGAWPWVALLGSKVGWSISYHCGGSLITSKHVLTAAHCTQIPGKPLSFARLGEYDTWSFTDGKHEDINIAKTMAHESWSMDLLINDIALLKLEKDVTFTDRIVPICLPSGPILTKSFVGQNPFFAGWGRVEEGNTKKPTILQQVQLPVISNAECKQKYSVLGGPFKPEIQEKFDSDVVVCAGYAEGGKDTCQGDSGGPLMLPEFMNGKFPYFQIGVNSYGYGCARPNVPGVYTSVRAYMPWINSKLLL